MRISFDPTVPSSIHCGLSTYTEWGARYVVKLCRRINLTIAICIRTTLFVRLCEETTVVRSTISCSPPFYC